MASRAKHKRKIDEKDSESESDSSSSTDEESEEDRKRQKRTTQKKAKKKKKKEHKEKKRYGAEKLSKDDFYNKSAEFRLWLTEKKKMFLDELSSKEAKKLFKKFVIRWNSGKLHETFYKGIPSGEMQASSRTRYKWKFASNIDEIELGSARDSVTSWTAGKTLGNTQMFDVGVSKDDDNKRVIGPQIVGPQIIGPQMPTDIRVPQPATSAIVEREERKERERWQKKTSDREYRKKKELVVDELLPKATGFEARVEKRIAAAQDRREREQSPDTSESFLMGGRDSFKSQIAARKKARERHQEKRLERGSTKIEEYAAKEKARMEALMAMAQANRKDGSLWQQKT